MSDRSPDFLTSRAKSPARRGVFAIGDVRAKSIKRVAAAVGEGAYVVAALHAFLTASPTLTDSPIFPIQRH